MLNQKHNIFKGQKSKSKIFITILCIFGLLFSWSCSCRNKVTGPGNDGLENGRPGPITDNKDGSVITPSMTLSTNLMIINVNGNDTKQKITITVDNADFEIADITGVEGLTKADFTLANGVLSLTKSFDKVDITEKTLTLTVNYKKKSTAGANDTLSKTTDKTTFKVIKAQTMSVDTTVIETLKTKLGNWQTTGLPTINFGSATVNGTIIIADVIAPETDTADNYDTMTVSKKDLSERLLNRLKTLMSREGYCKDVTYVENTKNGDNEVFYYNLVVNETYELADTKIGIELVNKRFNDDQSKNYAVNWTD